MEIRVSPHRIRGVLIGIGSALVALHGLVWGAVLLLGADPQAFWVELFDLDHERNLPTLFSSLLLLGCAGLLTLVGGHHRREAKPSAMWWALGAIFAFLAVDETAGLHEALVPALRRGLHTYGLLRPAWVLVYGGALLLLAALGWKWFWSLPRFLRKRFFFAGGLYLAGALGLEMLGGLKHSLFPEDPLALTCLLCALEEGLEMAGLIAMLVALWSYLQQLGGLRLTLEGT